MRNAFLCLIFGFSIFINAQKSAEKGLKTITKTTAEAHISFLADDELEGRESGFRGSRIAKNYIISQLKQYGVEPLYTNYLQPFKAYRANCQSKENKRYTVADSIISILKKEPHYQLDMNNVLGIIRGKKANEYVIVGAHYDHMGKDIYLNGDQIYNGADDNASGVSAVLQLVKAFSIADQKPERTIIFAFWDGEERGLLGSDYFTQNFKNLAQIKGYLNYDMIGRNNRPDEPRHFVYFYTAKYPMFENWLRKDISQYKLRLSPDYRAWENPVGGSDNGSFAKFGIPIVWFHTDGHADYHQPSDIPEKLNWEKLVDITKASYLILWKMANEPRFP